MPFELPFSYRTTNPVAINEFYAAKQAIGTPENGWASVADAVAGVPAGIRYYGLTVGVRTSEGIVEYWWRLSLADNGLILKTTASVSVVNVLGSSTTDAASQKLLTDELAKKAATGHTHVASDVTDFAAAADARVAAAAGKSIAPLVNGLVPTAYLPAYVSEVVERDSLAAFPSPGVANTIYVARDSNISYRWTGTQYTKIGDGQGVESFNGRTGNITLTQEDVDAFLSTLKSRVTNTEKGITQIQGLIPGNASPQNQLVTRADLPSTTPGNDGAGDAFTISGITEFRDRFAVNETGTAAYFFEKLLKLYQNIRFSKFTFQYFGSLIQEVGQRYDGGQRIFEWTLENGANVAANSISIQETQTGVTYASNLANDGQEIVQVPAFNLVKGLTRRFVITATDTKGNPVTAEVTLTGAHLILYGAVSAEPTTASAVRYLPSSRYTTEESTFILNTGSAYRRFAVWVPSGQRLLQVLDLDSSNANITSAYQTTSFTAGKDTAGGDVPGALWVNTQAIAYSSNHRHQITIG